MRMRIISYLSLPILIIALIAWAGVVYAHTWIAQTALEKGASTLSADQKAAQSAHASRVRAIAQDTATQRETLEGIVFSDVTDFADTIEATGKSVGVSVNVKAALPVGSAKKIAEGASVHTLAFIIEAQGSFSGLIRLTKALETFPAFASINQFDLERVPLAASSAASWRAVIRLHVITTSDVSS